MRKTKIICTLGPATDDDSVLENLICGGMDVARINFSHGDEQERLRRIEQLKRLRQKLGKPVALLLDTKGPEIRLGCFKGGSCHLEQGSVFTLLNNCPLGDAECAEVSYKTLWRDVHVGDSILLDDGFIRLTVLSSSEGCIACRVENSGVISDRKGVNVPGVRVRLPAMSEQDRADVRFGIANGFDFIAASFIRRASDIDQIRSFLYEMGGDGIRLIAKIENREGVENSEEIIEASDGIMVARGDMGVEIPLEEVPCVQKKLIHTCYTYGKPAITATQMLDSMMHHPRPTRAEATDVANAVYDGTSCLMLSGETAAGKYPCESLAMMVRIAEAAESDIHYWHRFLAAGAANKRTVTNAISHATCMTAMDLEARAIVTVTQSGKTARMISRFRPACPIVATATDERVWRQLSLSWGVEPYLVDKVNNTDELLQNGIAAAQKAGYAAEGDTLVITAGVPVGVAGTTNLLRVHTMGTPFVASEIHTLQS